MPLSAPASSALAQPPLALPDGPRRADRPLVGVTLLAVEDSRFTCDALRLLCQRNGARLRRAETLAAAQAHLRLYRPDAILVDLGLPDGRGETLIATLAPRAFRPALIALSGDPDAGGAALAAGADAFLPKPLPGPAAFESLLLTLLTGRSAPAQAENPLAAPDLLALHDDLRHAADLLGNRDPGYVAGFVQGIARSARDAALEQAAQRLRRTGEGAEDLRSLLAARLAAPGLAAIAAPPPADRQGL